MNKLRRLEIYVLKGENLLSTEMEIVLTEFLLSGGMKQAMRNTRRSVGGVAVNHGSFTVTAQFLSMLLSVANASHGIASGAVGVLLLQ